MPASRMLSSKSRHSSSSNNSSISSPRGTSRNHTHTNGTIATSRNIRRSANRRPPSVQEDSSSPTLSRSPSPVMQASLSEDSSDRDAYIRIGRKRLAVHRILKKFDPLSTTVRHFGRVHDMWRRFAPILQEGLKYDKKNTELELYSKDQQHHIKLFLLLKADAPDILHVVRHYGIDIIADLFNLKLENQVFILIAAARRPVTESQHPQALEVLSAEYRPVIMTIIGDHFA
ncbi:hypothetical protein JB92DRAFT_2830701 [Gautieria morchelliformis]|nr:hypothetical protein JB92DRAFT_2830701 [Gautieria morchelliformis]